MSTKIRVLIADEQKEVLDQLSELINSAPDMIVVDTVTNGVDLVAYFSKENPGVDIALIDIGMPEMDGLTAVTEIKKTCQNPPKMLVITGLRGHDFPTAAVSHFQGA